MILEVKALGKTKVIINGRPSVEKLSLYWDTIFSLVFASLREKSSHDLK